MASYRVEIKRSAAKEIAKLPASVLPRVIRKIEALQDDPRPQGCNKLSGDEKYRIRVGDYRILYSIEEEVLIVYVVRVRYRKEVYRGHK